MKKILLTLTAIAILASCDTNSRILYSDEYTIVDTINVNKNGFDFVLSYDVIILNHYDSMLHAGSISPNGRLTDYTAKPLNIQRDKNDKL